MPRSGAVDRDVMIAFQFHSLMLMICICKKD